MTREQLIGLGVAETQIDHWVRSGRLIVRHRGVYSFGHVSLPPFSDAMAAVLAVGGGAMLSHSSAAHLWGIRQASDEVHVTVVGRHVRRRPGITIHHVRFLDPVDARTRFGIPVTSPARTLIDIGGELDDRELELGLHEAIATKLVSLHRLRTTLDRYPHRRGTARLTELCAREGPTTITNVGAEEALHRSLRRAGLPAPRVNSRVGRWSVDFYWPQHRLVVEVDGVDWHSSRPRIERDHRKDLDLRKLGIDVMRFTGGQVHREPEMILVAIAQELARRS